MKKRKILYWLLVGLVISCQDPRIPVESDTTPPDAPIIQGPSLTNESRPTFSWNNPKDAVDFRYRLDGSSWKYTSLTSLTPDYDLSEGNHSLEVQACDKAENWSRSGILSFIIDFQATPAPILTGISDTNNPRPTWEWTIPSDAVDIRYRLDTEDWIEIGNTDQTSFTPDNDLDEGSHILEVQALDAAGNWSTSGSWTINIDFQATEVPEVVGTSPTNNPRPIWSWDVPADTIEFRYRLNQEDWIFTANTSITSFSPDNDLTEGSYTLDVQSVDAAGNWSESGSFTIIIDFEAPSAPIVTGINLTNNQRPTWSWDIPNDTVDLRINLDNEEWVRLDGISQTSYTPDYDLEEGSHSLAVQALDNAGNWSDSGIFIISIDITPPTAPVVEGTSYSNSARPIWTWNIPVSTVNLRYRFGGQWTELDSITINSFTPDYDLTEGEYLFEIEAVDSVGNWSETGSLSITVDFTPPSAPTVTGDSLTSDSTPSWTWNIPADTAGFRYQLDDNDWVTVNSSTTSFTPTAALSDGNHTLLVQSRDLAQNWSESGESTILIDSILENGPIFSGSAITNNSRPILSWSSPSGAVDFRYDFNHSGWVQGNVTSFTPDTDLIEGEYTLTVQALSALGNWSPSESFSITIDLTPPAIPVLDGEAQTGETSPTWSCQEDNTGSYFRFRYSLNDSPWFEILESEIETEYISGIGYSYIFKWDTPLEIGEYVFTLQVSDEAGNWSDVDTYTTIVEAPWYDLQPYTNIFDAPEYASWGDSVSILFSTVNEGNATCDSSVSALYLSSDSTITRRDTLLAEVSIQDLKANTHSRNRVTVTIPSTMHGKYYIGFIVDSDNDVSETYELNNTYSQSIIIVSPDFPDLDNDIWSDSCPATAKIGDEIDVSVGSHNSGEMSAGPFDIYVYLSRDKTINTSDIHIGTGRETNGLSPGSGSGIDVLCTIPDSISSGYYYIGYIIDGANEVIETNENNNTSTRLYSIIITN